jgi:uncharacterized protein YbjT (DUF2867 family)
MTTILVIGATGTVGRALTDELLTAGVAVLALVRDPSAAELPAAVEVVRGDLADPASIDGRRRRCVPAVAVYRAGVGDELAADVAQRLARTGRIVYLSAEASIRAPDRFWGRVERVVERIAPRWTVLRPTGFASNARIWAGLQTWAGFADQPEVVTDEVQTLLGRAALPFARWAGDHVQDFR